MLVNVGVSNRHVHLTKETYSKLFPNEYLTIKRNLTQPGQFASTKTVDVIINDRIIPNVRVVGPLREYNQVELLASDFLDGEKKPLRKQSGDLNKSMQITLKHDNNFIDLNKGLILAIRHVHMNKEMADSLGLKHNDEVFVFKDGNFYFNAFIKITDDAAFELHIDKDEARHYNLETGDKVDLRLCGK